MDWIRRDDPRWGPPPEDLDRDDELEEYELPAPRPRRMMPPEPSSGPEPHGARGPGLDERFAALARFTRAVAPYLTADEAPGLAPARALAERAGTRLSLGHTVVAFAGATGVGKSSLFNAVAGMALSPAGHLRPTTGEAYACVWETVGPGGRGAGSDPLLAWLKVAPGRRFLRESVLDADREASLRGLVLLDLPDVDSIAAGNRIEADRLVGIVDRVVWVLDPQKYADRTVHEEYLRQLGALRDVTVVVFNQCDRLSPDDAKRCRDDLARLVAADGLTGVPVLGASTVTGEGVGELRGLLATAVADRRAAVARLEAEVDDAVARLSALVPAPGPGEELVSRTAVPELADALAEACAVPTLAVEAAAAYRARSVLWRAPWHRAAYPDVPSADPVAVAAAVRQLGDRVGAMLPQPWPRHLREAAGAQLPRLPDELAIALQRARGFSPVPPAWVVARTAWWLCLALAVTGVVTGLPTLALWAGGLTVALPAAAVLTGAWRALRYRRAVQRRLQLAALTVAREVVAPVRTVLRAYEAAHAELAVARVGSLDERATASTA